jgi:putative flippase GtrA
VTIPLFNAKRLRSVRKRHGRRMAKYFIGSVIAFFVSTATFGVAFGTGLLGSKGASLTASATGAIVNYFLNRNWAWGVRGRADVRRELIPYWRTVIVTAIAAALVTGAVNAVMRDMGTDRSVRTVVNTIAFVATYGIAFLFKYRMFDRLFRGHHRRRDEPAIDVVRPSAPVQVSVVDPVEGGSALRQPASRMSSGAMACCASCGPPAGCGAARATTSAG